MSNNIPIEILLNNPTMFNWWPKDIPRPTIEEYRVAELRYKKSIRENDFSDYRSGLSFVMSTYHPFIWLRFFFPFKYNYIDIEIECCYTCKYHLAVPIGKNSMKGGSNEKLESLVKRFD